MLSPNSDLMRQSNCVGVRFLFAEMDAGLTFLAISTSTALPGNREQCLKNACAVYGVVLRLLPRVDPAPDEKLELHRRMAELRNGLIDAGCCPDAEVRQTADGGLGGLPPFSR